MLRSRILRLLSLLPLLTFVVSCTDTEIVFRDREPFNPPQDAALGFLGYFNVGTRTTTCGNCHVGTQRDWKQTRHANAFQTLADLGANAQPFCFSCHTVTSRGNDVAGPAGWDAVQDSVYHDVQCENCHGPGLNHVVEPDNRSNIPLARASIGADASVACAECHSGAHHPFAEEWAQSGHAGVVTFAAGRADCESCHNGKATLLAWGEPANYVEKGDGSFFPVTCTVCHDPHGSPNSKQLRFPIDSPDPEVNLCMKCHLRRADTQSGSSSPHAPQGAVLLGTAGYRPQNFLFDSTAILTSHGSDRNPELCAGCHVRRFEVTDPATGGFVFQATGHLFRPIPCLDAQGKPTGDKTCAYTETARSFKTCTASGCHASETIAAQRFVQIRAELEALVGTLWIDSNGNRSIDAAPTDQGMLPTVKAMLPGEFTSTSVTPARGAEFNARLAGERNQSNSDNSKGVHNPFLLRALVSASINEVRTFYNLPAPPAQVQQLIDASLIAGRAPESAPAAESNR